MQLRASLRRLIKSVRQKGTSDIRWERVIHIPCPRLSVASNNISLCLLMMFRVIT